MAQGARRGCVKASQCPTGGGVIELAVRPQNRVMAAFAGRRETQSDVVDRSLRVVVVGLVAGDAGRSRDLVIAVHVALGARQGCVESGQRPACRGMVELAIRPQHCVVAVFARRREARSDVVNRSLRVVVVGLVACHAGRAGQVVVVIDVALHAGRRRVEASQGPTRCGVIEFAVRPQHGVMATCASGWEA